MGSLANSLFRFMLGWLQGIVSAVWSAFTTENGGSFFTWIGEHWIPIAVVLCLIGLITDLCVYLIRWKPFRRGTRRYRQDAEPRTEQDVRHIHPGTPGHSQQIPEPAETRVSVREDSEEKDGPDLSRWQDEPRTDRSPVFRPEEIPATVTKAGYTVPADSPYRRPAVTPATENNTVMGRNEEPSVTEIREEKSAAITSRSRRRIRISDLFSDPEEDLRQAEAPQNVIDSRKAYHSPVYPRGWQQNGGGDQ